MTNDDRFALLEDETRIRARLDGDHRYPSGLWDKRRAVLFLLAAEQAQEPSSMMADLQGAAPTFTDTPGELLITVRIESIDRTRRVLTVTAAAGVNKRATLEVPEHRILWCVAPPL